MTERPYRRLSPLTPLVRSFIFVVAVVSASWRPLVRGELGPFGWIMLGILAAGLVYGGASWFRTKFWVEADELRVDTGVISRQSRRIRIDRLQGIDIVQPFVARLFGLAELKLDVAGGSAREGSLAFLRLREAEELKVLLLARRAAVLAKAQPDDGTEAADHEPAAESDQLLARVDLGTLLASIVLSPESVALVLAVLILTVGFVFAGSWAGFSAMLPIMGGAGLVLFRRLSANYRFRVTQTSSGLQVSRGMFELTTATIALSRVQGVVVSEPLMWKPLGWARLDVAIAGYAGADGDSGVSASTVLPVGPRNVVLYLARHMLGGLDPAQTPLSPPPKRARWVAPIGRHFMSAGISDEVAVSREGWLTRRTHIVPHARVQSLRLSQGPWQRYLGLADLHLDSPPGPTKVRARHRPVREARGLLEAEMTLARAARLHG